MYNFWINKIVNGYLPSWLDECIHQYDKDYLRYCTRRLSYVLQD